MPFKKKIYRGHDGAGVPVYHVVSEETESIVNGNRVVSNVCRKVDACTDVSAFPDVETFNDLDSQIAAGVPLARVNTRVLVNSDVAENNESMSDMVDNNVLKVENNETEN